MAVLNLNSVKQKVIEILPIYDVSVYDSQLDVLISGAISKLRNEGLPIDAMTKDGVPYFNDGTGEGESPYAGNDYAMCVAYQVMKDMDYDVDSNFLTEQYITRVNTIRCNYRTVRQI